MNPEGVNSSGDESEEDRPAADSPFQSSQEAETPAGPKDPSVFAEPWMNEVLHPEDERDPGPALPSADSPLEDQSVWDEPGLSRELAGDTPEDGITWYRWYRRQEAKTSSSRSWLVTLTVALTSGVFAVAGTIAQQSAGGGWLLSVVVFGPTVEEVMKIALPLWLVERRPWLYRNPGQILISALVSGGVFAAVENMLYLKVYIDNPSAGLVLWRWTVCVLLHAGCSTIAGIGACRIWQKFRQEERAPRLTDGATFLVIAIVLHGLYNGTVTLLESSGLEF